VELRKFLSTFNAASIVPAAPIQTKKHRQHWRHGIAGVPWIALLTFVVVYSSVPASASGNGISGFSGKSGSTCTSCHSSSTAPTVTMSGPASVTSGSTNSYTISVSTVTAGNGGVDVAASAGTFAAGTGTKVLNGEIVHSSPSSSHTWTFSWTAPTVTATTTATLYAAAIDSFSGGTGTLQQGITVTAAAPAPTIGVSPASLSFNYQSGGATPAAQSIAVSSSAAALNYTVATSATWLNATPASGTTAGNVSVSVNPGSLAAGTYTGTVSITSSGASNSPKTVPVTLTVTATSAPTLSASPLSLSFTFQAGGTTPAAQTVNVTGSSALSYTAATSAGWLSVTPASGNTPGNLSISVNPAGLAAGTYSGAVAITAAGASNSPQKVAVTLAVTGTPPANPSLNITPGNLTFTYASGTSTSGTQSLSVASNGTALNITAAASGGAWLTVTPTAGPTPATIKVSANATGLAAGTYNGTVTITSDGAANSPQTVPVKLVVTGTGSGRLRVWPPRAVSFAYQSGQSDPGAKTIRVLSTGTPLGFTAAAHGGTWVSVTPSGGTTPGTLSISVDPSGLASGTYTATIALAAPGSAGLNVPVILRVASGDDDGGGGDGGGGDDGSSLHAWPYAYDPAASNTVAATWVDGTGASSAATTTTTDIRNQGLLLSKTSAASNQAQAGVVIRDVEGISLTELGFDIREGSQCTVKSPRFVVVTSDDVVHKIGCATGTAQPAPAAGWKRLRFDPANPAQTAPVISSGSKVKSIYLVLDDGPETGSSIVVLDNININGKFIGQQ
jgi:Viral BACON domain